ncbi:MFS transporter [Marinovum sp.]|uniref:MFS transporter n=1 Tax=Marinovum sp. TaxID=2024839 RepID=UPI002B27A1EC|nr:MFS transporter [Marinovum sp.]
MAALLCGTSATVLESMAIGVTLPFISRDFAVSAASVTWVMGASEFVIVALLLPMAALGEAIGYRQVYLGALALFVVATLTCMLAPGFGVIVAARAAQAVGTAGVMSLGFALLRSVLPEDRLGRAIGLMAATVALASSLGPAVSGLILSVASWRAVFGMLSAIALIAFVLSLRVLPATPPSGKRYDLVGAILVAALFSAALVVINGLANGWPPALLGVAAVAFGLLLLVVLTRSRGAQAPVFPLDLLARPVFLLSISASVCAFSAQSIGFILLPFYLLFTLGMGELQMALTLSVWPAATAILAPVMGRFADRIPAGTTGAAGLIVMAAGFVLIARAGDTASPVDIALRLAVCGAGFAVFQTPNNRTIMLAAPRDRSGAASGTLSIARQFGRATGTAIAAFSLLAGPSAALAAMSVAAAIACLGAFASVGRTFLKSGHAK